MYGSLSVMKSYHHNIYDSISLQALNPNCRI